MSTKQAYDFTAKADQYRQFTDAQLAYSVQDATEARDAMRGHDDDAENWYADDVHTLLAEINRRKRQ